MSDIGMIAGAVIAVVVGSYGLYKAAFARGYANGYEDATHPQEVKFTEDD